MAIFLYLETNVLLSYATGRSGGTETILSNPPGSLRPIIPSVCFMEAPSVLESERKRNSRWLESLDQRLNEVKRNVLSSRVPSLALHLERSLEEDEELFKEFEAGLSLAFEALALTAELIHPSPSILLASMANRLVDDPSDNLILASILDHSINHPSETKIFLSENRGDFINPPAKLAFGSSGVRFFADPAKFLEWQRARAES